jgi:DNA polymerase-3 subunit delta
MLPLWPVDAGQLPGWIMQRGKQTGVILTPDAAKLLAEQVEGNLLAAAQEIEKLALLQTSGIINASTIEDTVTDNARFDIFGLVDAALSGDAQRCIRILTHLQAEGSEPILVLWALAREIRTLMAISRESAGTSLASLFGKYRIWEKRQRGVRQFLQKHPLASCRKLLLMCSKIDQIAKGAKRGNVWDALQLLALQMAGNDILTV